MESIVGRITNALSNFKKNDKARNYIGASSIGHPCLRSIWYAANGTKSEFNQNSLLIFEFGRLIELLVTKILSASDIEIIKPSKDNKNLAMASKDLPEFKGHADGVIVDGNHKYILEIKSANNSQFNQCIKHGVKEWKEQYYSQAQCYMQFSDSDAAIFIVINKDNSKIHVELIERDRGFYAMLHDKASRVKHAETPPDRIHNSPSYFICKMCSYKKTCFSGGNN